MSDESRRCPRCDCPDGAEQCDHCKVCPHAAELGRAATRAAKPRDCLFGRNGRACPASEPCATCDSPSKTSSKGAPKGEQPSFVVALHEDDGTLLVGIHPDGSITTGPNYQPDQAAREFWDAVTRAAQAANPFGVSDD